MSVSMCVCVILCVCLCVCVCDIVCGWVYDFVCVCQYVIKIGFAFHLHWIDRVDFIVYEEFFTPKVKSGDVFRSTILMSTLLFDFCF